MESASVVSQLQLRTHRDEWRQLLCVCRCIFLDVSPAASVPPHHSFEGPPSGLHCNYSQSAALLQGGRRCWMVVMRVLLEIQAWWRHSSLHPTFITIITAAPTAWLLALPAIFTSSFFCICIIPCYIRWFIYCLGYLVRSAPFYIATLISHSFNFSNSASFSSST